SAKRLVCAYTRDSTWKLAMIDTERLESSPVDLPYQDISYVTARPGSAIFRAGSPTESAAIVRLDLNSRAIEVLRRSAPEDPAVGRYFSLPRAIEFPTTGGTTAHAFYYPPQNPDFVAAGGTLPPLLVKS